MFSGTSKESLEDTGLTKSEITAYHHPGGGARLVPGWPSSKTDLAELALLGSDNGEIPAGA